MDDGAFGVASRAVTVAGTGRARQTIAWGALSGYETGRTESPLAPVSLQKAPNRRAVDKRGQGMMPGAWVESTRVNEAMKFEFIDDSPVTRAAAQAPSHLMPT